MRRVLRNIFSNWTGYFVTVVVGFFLAPFVLHHLGNTGYGVWTLVLSLTGYFGLLDLGIRSSVGRFVARYVALADEDQVIIARLALPWLSWRAVACSRWRQRG